jgi:hypothetical protein
MTTPPYRIPPPPAPPQPTRPAPLVALLASVVGLVLCVGVGVHELQYRADHPFASGPAGVIAVLAFAAAAGCLGVAALAWESMRRPH